MPAAIQESGGVYARRPDSSAQMRSHTYQDSSPPPRLEGEGHDSRARIVPTQSLRIPAIAQGCAGAAKHRMCESGHPWRSDGGVRTAFGTAVEGGGVDKQRFSEAVGVADFCTPYEESIE